MPVHWTYEAYDDSDELEQGDLLQPTEALQRIFASVHPHFRNSKYLAYIITTQSCDLVLRRSQPKASYINLATVRPLSEVLHKILGTVAKPIGVGIFRSSAKGDVRRFLERLLNQNEQASGLFFIHADSDLGIAEPAVAFLRVTVALRADHYDVLRAARVGRLTPEFRAKLGWLTGNLYARPATQDWGEKADRRKLFNNLIDQAMREARWIDDEIVERAAKEGIDLSTASPESVDELRSPSRLDRALEELEAQLTEIAPDLTLEQRTKLRNRLRNSGKFTKLLK
jgi:hypothetical protein